MAVTIDNRCTGCSACAAVCPTSCITMTDNAEGFSYPHIDQASCVGCDRCETVCPLNSKELSSPVKSYLFCTSDCKALSRCASGGAISELTSSFIEADGTVVGVSDDIVRGSRFVLVDSVASLPQLAGSKYYQCNLDTETLHSIVTILRAGRKVLFCGTPCQVQAVKEVVPHALQSGLLLADIVCQGVPSRAGVHEYRKGASLRKGSPLVSHVFRAKLKGHEGQYITRLVYENGDCETSIGADDLYARSFMYQVSLRESCYQCPFADSGRAGDLTFGDYWAPNLDGTFERGSTSLILVNTDKGSRMAAALKSRGRLLPIDVDEAVQGNIPLHHPVKRPRCRSYFYKIMSRFGFSAAVRICCWRYPIKRLVGNIHG